MFFASFGKCKYDLIQNGLTSYVSLAKYTFLINHINVQDLAVQAERLSEQLRRYQVNILYYFLT